MARNKHINMQFPFHAGLREKLSLDVRVFEAISRLRNQTRDGFVTVTDGLLWLIDHAMATDEMFMQAKRHIVALEDKVSSLSVEVAQLRATKANTAYVDRGYSDLWKAINGLAACCQEREVKLPPKHIPKVTPTEEEFEESIEAEESVEEEYTPPPWEELPAQKPIPKLPKPIPPEPEAPELPAEEEVEESAPEEAEESVEEELPTTAPTRAPTSYPTEPPQKLVPVEEFEESAEAEESETDDAMSMKSLLNSDNAIAAVGAGINSSSTFRSVHPRSTTDTHVIDLVRILRRVRSFLQEFRGMSETEKRARMDRKMSDAVERNSVVKLLRTVKAYARSSMARDSSGLSEFEERAQETLHDFSRFMASTGLKKTSADSTVKQGEDNSDDGAHGRAERGPAQRRLLAHNDVGEFGESVNNGAESKKGTFRTLPPLF